MGDGGKEGWQGLFSVGLFSWHVPPLNFSPTLQADGFLLFFLFQQQHQNLSGEAALYKVNPGAGSSRRFRPVLGHLTRPTSQVEIFRPKAS